MRQLRDLSFRYKIPLRGAVLVAITAVSVTLSLTGLEYEKLRSELIASSASLGRVLAKTLVTPLAHDDLWRAFEIINTPFHPQPGAALPQEPREIMILDGRGRVYASTHPSQYPVLSSLAETHPELREFRAALGSLSEAAPTVIEVAESQMLYVLTPVVADGITLGSLVMGYSKSAFVPRFVAIAKRAGLVTLIVVAVLIPATWFWARRFAQPLVALAHNMERVGRRLPEEAEIHLEESEDELGKAATAFRRMVAELREKEALERQVIVSERLAAIGQITAGIAHEVNNPLGGMLNAINTYKHHGKVDPFTNRTLSMLERGLLQIKETVAALLVEARVEQHPLARQDIEDVHTLVAADAQRKSARFVWENDLVATLPLPSTLVRQVLINLLLNAVSAIEREGRVQCHVYRDSRCLYMIVTNDGAHIGQDDMDHLFEPFASSREGGHGLGLWVSYQIVTQLGGEITVSSEPGETRFSVTIPAVEERA
ncbi:MAG: hypothetical protein Fur0039_15950 [Rhodocyclaceae bacterium]